MNPTIGWLTRSLLTTSSIFPQANVRQERKNPYLRCLAVAAAWLVLTAPTARAQRIPGDPVEELRFALRLDVDPTNAQDVKARRTELEKRAAALRSVSQMRRALVLQDWRDEDPEPRVAEIDRAVRQEIAKRLENTLRGAVERGSLVEQLAAITAIAEMGSTVRGVGTTGSFARALTPDLARLVERGDPPVRNAAAFALSRSGADPELAARTLARMLRSSDVEERRVGAQALAGMVGAVLQLARVSNTTGVRAGRGDVVNVSRAVLDVVGPGLRDPDASVRGASLQAVLSAAATFSLAEVVAGPLREETTGRGAEQARAVVSPTERGEFMPVLRGLAQLTPDVAALLSDPSPSNRLLAARTLDDISYARVRMFRRAPAPSPTYGGAADRAARVILVAQTNESPPARAQAEAPDDIVARALSGVLPEVGRGLRDPDVRVRLALIDSLEMLDRAATPAIPAMVGALADPDRFVRWQSARTLGKLDPARAAPRAVPGLVRMLDDDDLDLRMAAAVALERYGPAAADAVPALMRTVGRGDPDGRIAATRALESIGMAAESAIPALAGNLTNPDARVRRVAAEALGRFGPAASSAIPALRRALEDSDDEVRTAASDALLQIVSTPPAR